MYVIFCVMSFLPERREGVAQTLLGGGEARAAFAEQLGGTAGVVGQMVDVAAVALHHAHDIIELGHTLGICKLTYWCKFHALLYYKQ